MDRLLGIMIEASEVIIERNSKPILSRISILFRFLCGCLEEE